jgi:hypothetical protein
MGKLAAALTVLVLALLAVAARATPQVVSLDSYCPPSDPAGGGCIGNWLAAGAGRDLYVPPGTWHYNRSFALASDTRIRCNMAGRVRVQVWKFE